MRRTRRLLSIAALLLASAAPAEIVERVVAVVNGDIITSSEFEARQVTAIQLARVTPDDIPRFLQQNNARLMQEAVDDLLLFQKGRELGMELRAAYIDQVIAGIKQQNNLQSDAELRAQLRSEGMTLDDLKRQVERSIIRRQVLQDEIGAGVTVTEAEAREEYQSRLETDYKRPATVRLESILLSNEREGAAELARRIVTRARSGEDFGALAQAHSDGPTASSGGDLGELVIDEMSEEIREVATALAPGEVSEPRATSAGLQVFRLVERNPESVVPFDEIKQDLTKQIAERRNRERYESYMEALRQNASIQLMVREVGLQVDLPTEPSLLDGGVEEAATPIDPGGEFSVGGSSGPRRVAPPPPEAKPTPEPTPQPR